MGIFTSKTKTQITSTNAIHVCTYACSHYSCRATKIQVQKNTKSQPNTQITQYDTEAVLNRQLELTVFGYIHQFEQLKLIKQIIPTSIIRMILLFYPRGFRFMWNMKKHGTDLIIYSQKVEKQIATSGWSTCVSNNVISSDIYNWYEWEFKLNDCINVYVGFVSTPISKTINNWNTFISNNKNKKYRKKHFVINFQEGYNYIRTYENNMMEEHYISKYKKIRENPQYKIRIDFRKKCMQFYLDGEPSKRIYNGLISSSVVAATSLYSGEITVTNNRYNLKNTDKVVSILYQE